MLCTAPLVEEFFFLPFRLFHSCDRSNFHLFLLVDQFTFLFILIKQLLFTLPYIIPFTFSFVLSFIRSFLLSFILQICFHSFIDSFIHSFIHSYLHPNLVEFEEEAQNWDADGIVKGSKRTLMPSSTQQNSRYSLQKKKKEK